MMRLDRWQQDCIDAGATWEGPGLARLALITPTLPPATTTNHYLVGETAAVLVDPSTPDLRAQDRLAAWLHDFAAAGGHVQALLLTHHHNDHSGAATQLAQRLGLPIWGHAKTAALLDGRVTVARLLGDGEAVACNADGSVWSTLFTPGHAPGHLALYHAPTATVVAGDLVAGVGTILIDPQDGDMGQYLASLARLEALQPAALAPAHGLVQRDAVALLQHYQRHRRAREDKLWAALTAEPCDAADLLPIAYADVARMAWPLALRSAISHLRHLHQQGRAESVGERWRRVVSPAS